MKRLYVTPERCIGCRACELACSFSHARDLAVPAMSRVRVYGFANDRYVPVLCLQCEDAACVKVCPTSALSRSAATQAVEVNREKCIKCQMCTVACPFGNIHWEAGADRIIKCDVCQGAPACARFCPSRTLEWGEQPSRGPVPKVEINKFVPVYRLPQP